MAHWQRGQKDEAGQWFRAGVLRMELGLPFRWGGTAAESDRLRREAEVLLRLDQAPRQPKSDDPERYSRIIAAQPEAAWAYQLRGQIHRRLGNTQQADADARRAHELLTRSLPTGPDALKELERVGRYYLTSNSWDMLIIVYSKAIELKNDELWFYNERGWAYIVLGQYRQAVKDYTQVIALNPHRGNFYARRGYAYLRSSEHDKALDDYAKVLELNPDYSGDGWSRHCAMLLGAGLCQWKDGRALAVIMEKLVRDAASADERSRFIKVYLDLAQTLSKRGRNEEAGKMYLRFLQLQPADAMGNNNAAWFLATCADVKFRDPGQAVKLAKKATELAHNEGTYWNTLGTAHYRAGDWKAAIAALDKSMELRKGGDSFDWFFLAMAHWQLGEKEKARTRFDQAVQWMDKHQPSDEELRRFRAEAAELLGIKDGKK